MVTLDLADTLEVGEGDRLTVEVATGPVRSPGGATWRSRRRPDNLVTRALAASDGARRCAWSSGSLPGPGLGGGSADAAAVLRWAGCRDPQVAVRLGADVPFCLAGGRARVTGIGEAVEPLPFEPRSFVLLLPPFGVDTAAVYRAWDDLRAGGRLPPSGSVTNDLEAAALEVEPRLEGWRQALEEAHRAGGPPGRQRVDLVRRGDPGRARHGRV